MDIPSIRSLDVPPPSGGGALIQSGTQASAQAAVPVPAAASGGPPSAGAAGSFTPVSGASASGSSTSPSQVQTPAQAQAQAQALQKAVAKLNQQLSEQSAGVTLSAGLDTSGQHPGQVLVELSDKQTNQTFYKHYLPPQTVIQAADQSAGASGLLLSTKA